MGQSVRAVLLVLSAAVIVAAPHPLGIEQSNPPNDVTDTVIGRQEAGRETTAASATAAAATGTATAVGGSIATGSAQLKEPSAAVALAGVAYVSSGPTTAVDTTSSGAIPPEEYLPTNPEAAAAVKGVAVVSAASILAGGVTAQPVPSAAELQAVAAGATSRSLIRCGVRNPSPAEGRAMQRELMSGLRQRAALGAASVNVPQVGTWFHIVRRGDALEDGNIPDSWVLAQLDVLNKGFANRVNFTLLGVTKTLNPTWFPLSFGSPQDIAMKRALRRGTKATLNVFITDLNDGLLGWATFPAIPRHLEGLLGGVDPTIDGVVVAYFSLPGSSATPYNLGATCTHEVGHWFLLFHTFESWFGAGSCRSLGGASGGDFVTDTPVEARPAFGCPVGRDSCPTLPGLDPIHNFMDYTEDACMDHFTAGQFDRMIQSWNAFRAPSA